MSCQVLVQTEIFELRDCGLTIYWRHRLVCYYKLAFVKSFYFAFTGLHPHEHCFSVEFDLYSNPGLTHDSIGLDLITLKIFLLQT